MRIGSTEISKGSSPYIIAELGVNHDGLPEKALELTKLAAEAGAHAIKLQLFKADLLMSKAAKLAAYQKAAGETDPIEMLRRLELSIEQMEPCVKLAHQLGIHAIVSVFSVELVREAERLSWDAYKTASPDIINLPLLQALADTGKPLIVSTGASTLEEIKRAIGWLKPIHNRLAILQCVSSYPTPPEQAELGGIPAIAEIWDGVVGYSDHTDGLSTGMDAVMLGARVLEKHFTYSRNAKGPDHAASLEPIDMKAYCLNAIGGPALADFPIDHVPAALRDAFAMAVEKPKVEAVKRVTPIEEDVRRVSRQSIVATRSLTAGTTLQRSDLTIKRPGTGVPPFELSNILGRKLTRAVEGDMPLQLQDLS